MDKSFENAIDFRVIKSGLEDFEMPTRNDHGGRIFCTQGNATIQLNDNTYYLVKNSSLAIFAHSTFRVISRSEDFNVIIFAYTVDFFQIASKDLIGLFPYYTLNPFIMRKEKDSTWIISSLEMLNELSSHGDYPYRNEMAICILRYFLMGICNRALMQKSISVSEDFQTHNYFNRLMYMLSLKCHEKRTVAYYASELCISPKHLNHICRQTTGSTAKEIIDQYLITQFKNYLNTSSKTILEISEAFDFPNPSFFGKFFLRHTGMTPGEYRKLKLRHPT